MADVAAVAKTVCDAANVFVFDTERSAVFLWLSIHRLTISSSNDDYSSVQQISMLLSCECID